MKYIIMDYERSWQGWNLDLGFWVPLKRYPGFRRFFIRVNRKGIRIKKD